MLARETPASIVAFDLLAEGDEVLLERPFSERRAALERLLADVGGHPVTPDAAGDDGGARGALARHGRGRDREAGRRALPARASASGMFKVRPPAHARLRHLAATGPARSPTASARSSSASTTSRARCTSSATARPSASKEKRELLVKLRPFETGEHGSGEASRWTAGRELEWVELRPELVVEVSYDHVSGGRIRHGTRVVALARRPRPEELQPRPARLGGACGWLVVIARPVWSVKSGCSPVPLVRMWWSWMSLWWREQSRMRLSSTGHAAAFVGDQVVGVEFVGWRCSRGIGSGRLRACRARASAGRRRSV